MSENNILNIIKARRSFRTFDERKLSKEDMDKLMAFCEAADNPYGIKVEFRFLEPKEHGLKSTVLKGETLYLGAKIKKQPHFEEAFGYSFEKLVLNAQSIGVGTVWIGGTMNRDAFERAMQLEDDEVMPCITPVGYPADKMSFRETMMRKSIKADTRYDISKIVFENEYGDPFTPEKNSDMEEVLEMVRWAPSAVNKQPWRLIISGNKVHFYEKPDKGYVSEATGDLQRIDVGIAMYHFAYGMESKGKNVTLGTEDPGINVPDGVKYIETFTFD